MASFITALLLLSLIVLRCLQASHTTPVIDGEILGFFYTSRCLWKMHIHVALLAVLHEIRDRFEDHTTHYHDIRQPLHSVENLALRRVTHAAAHKKTLALHDLDKNAFRLLEKTDQGIDSHGRKEEMQLRYVALHFTRCV